MSMPEYSPILVVVFLFSSVIAETVQSGWTVPNGNLPDFRQTFTDAETLPLAWNGWTSDWTNEYLDGDTVANLWVTSFNYGDYEYAQLLQDSVNISQTGTYTWNININVTSLANTAEYVVRFMAPGSTYSATSLQISSPGFIILPARSTTSTFSSQPSTTTTAAPSITSGHTSTPTPVPTTTTTTGLSIGAKVGVGVGSALAGIVVAALLGFAIRRYWRKPTSSPLGEPPTYQEPKPVYSSGLHSLPAELHGESTYERNSQFLRS